jgi:hypothetical protein
MRRDRTKSAYTGFLRALRTKTIVVPRLPAAEEDENLPREDAPSPSAPHAEARTGTAAEGTDA